MKVKSESEVAQSCLTLSDPMNCSLPVSSAHGIFQARVLEWVAIAFSIVSYFRSNKILARIIDTGYTEISSLKSVIIIYMFHFMTVTLVSYIFKYPPKKVCRNRYILCNCNILNTYIKKLMLKFIFNFFFPQTFVGPLLLVVCGQWGQKLFNNSKCYYYNTFVFHSETLAIS